MTVNWTDKLVALGASLLAPSSLNVLFYRYSELQLHGTEESRNKHRSNDGDRTGEPQARKAAH